MEFKNSVETLIIALTDSLADREKKVQDSVSTSIYEIGKKLPKLTTTLCANYLEKHQKLPETHRASILRVIERILNYHTESWDQESLELITKVAVSELTMPKEIIPVWQTAASDVLVETGKHDPNLVCTSLAPFLQPGQLPQFFVLQTMGNLAEANPKGMVHNLRMLFSRILPMMGMVKQENYRWVYTAVLYKFCLALIDFQANADEQTRATFSPQQFENDAFSAYEVLLTGSWVGNKDLKALNSIVSLAHEWNSPHLKPSIELIMKDLLTEIQANNEAYENGLEQAVKNQNELLRTLTTLGKHSPSTIWPWLLQRMEQAGNNDKLRIVLLVIYRHLVYTYGKDPPTTTIFDYKSILVSSLRTVLGVSNPKIIKYLSQLIVAMACHGYLQLEGRTYLIEYIIRNCNYQLTDDKPLVIDSIPSTDVRIMCRNILNAFSSTIEGMDEILWPLLMEFLTPEMYTGSFGILCKALTQAGTQQMNMKKDTFWIDYEAMPNLPKPNEIITRCFCLLGEPFAEEQRGISIMNFLKIAVTELNPSLKELWDKVIPRLLENLNDDANAWQDLVLKLLSKSLDIVDREDFVTDIGACFLKQLPLYTKLPKERGFSYKCLGIVLRKSKMNELISRTLETMLTTINFQNEHERIGWATMFGFCSTTHLDLVLQRLEGFLKLDPKGGSGGLFGFLKDKSDPQTDICHSTTILAYSYVSIYAPLELIVSRLETAILKSACAIAHLIKDETAKSIVAKSFVILAQSMNKNHLKTDFTFASRNLMIQEMSTYISQDSSVLKLNPATYSQILKACHSLIILQPEPTQVERYNLARTTFQWYFSTKTEINANQQEDIEKTLGALAVELITLTDPHETFPNLVNLLEPYCLSNVTHERQRSFQILNEIVYADSLNYGLKEQNSSDVGGALALCLIHITDSDAKVQSLADNCLQKLLRLQPYFTIETNPDSIMQNNGKIDDEDRVEKDETIQNLSSKLSPLCLLPFVEKCIDIISDVKYEGSIMACNVLCKVFAVRCGELTEQIEYLFTVMYEKYNKLTNDDLLKSLRSSFKQLSISCPTRVFQTLMNFGVPYNKNLVTIIHDMADNRELTEAVLAQIMECWSRSLPYDEKDSQRYSTANPLMALYLLNEWLQSSRMCDLGSYAFPRLFVALFIRMASNVDALPPLNIPPIRRVSPRSATITTPVPTAEPGKRASESSSKRLSLFESKSSRSSTSQSTQSQQQSQNQPINDLKKIESWKLSNDCMKNFLHVYKLDHINDLMTWSNMAKEDTCHSGFETLAQGLCSNGLVTTEHLNVIIEMLTSVLDGPYDIQRICVTSFFAQMIKLKRNIELQQENYRLAQDLIHSLLGRLVDQNINVRKFCLRGLGNTPLRDLQQDRNLPTTILASLISGLDDRDDKNDLLTLEAMCSLSNVIDVISEDEVRPILMNVLLRIRPCFEKDAPEVRRASFTLFGKMASIIDGPSRESFIEQIFSSLITLTLHLNDPSDLVKESCKTCYQALAPLLEQKSLNDLLKKTFVPNEPFHYGEFIDDLCKILVTQYPFKINFFIMNCIMFFKSPVPELRANAAIVAGYLLFNLNEEQIRSLSKEHILNAFIVLLKDSSTDVRCRTAEAISFMYQF